MSLVRFDPFRGFENLSRRMHDFVGEFDKGFNFEYGSFAPRVDIMEDEKTLSVHAELPGIKKEDVKVSINDDNVLIIKGEKKREVKQEEKDDNCTYIRVERNYGSFSRTFMLPDNINTDSVSANYENGILTLLFDKKEPQKPKEVNVEIK